VAQEASSIARDDSIGTRLIMGHFERRERRESEESEERKRERDLGYTRARAQGERTGPERANPGAK
jgi:hypothetical protein